MSLAESYQIPNFVSARSERSLRAKFRKVQMASGKKYQIVSITWTGSRWVLWYHDDVNDAEFVKEALEEIRQGRNK